LEQRLAAMNLLGLAWRTVILDAEMPAVR